MFNRKKWVAVIENVSSAEMMGKTHLAQPGDIIFARVIETRNSDGTYQLSKWTIIRRRIFAEPEVVMCEFYNRECENCDSILTSGPCPNIRIYK